MGFPSPYGVSFILIVIDESIFTMEYITRFPSPYGVSFILIQLEIKMLDSTIVVFPSPYGVSFILMYIGN